MVIMIIGVLATVATTRMGSSIETAKFEQTKNELDHLAFAIAGNPSLFAEGARTDFGYVGDVGSLPPNLDALMSNPGGYTTWNGPYIAGDFESDGYKKDAWNMDYTYADTLIRSSGSGTNIDKVFAAGSAALFSNRVEGYVVDADSDAPGPVYMASLEITMIYPNGTGSVATASTNPDAHGSFAFAGIPIGNHQLRIVYIPDTDTATYMVSVTPGSTVKVGLNFPADLW